MVPIWWQMNVTIKDLPPRLHRALKARALANKRSLNWEVIDIIEQAVERRPLDVEEFLTRIAPVRERIKGPHLSEVLLTRAKGEGRK